jgi:hypothetical protein
MTLHPSKKAAVEAKAALDASGCGGSCFKMHRIRKLGASLEVS